MANNESNALRRHRLETVARLVAQLPALPAATRPCPQLLALLAIEDMPASPQVIDRPSGI